LKYLIVNVIAWICALAVAIFAIGRTHTADTRIEIIDIDGRGVDNLGQVAAAPEPKPHEGESEESINAPEVLTDTEMDTVDISSRNPAAVALNDSAAVLLAQGNYRTAVSFLHRAIAIDSAYARAHYNLGVAYHQVNKMGNAVAEYEKAAQLRPFYYKPIYNLGLLYLSIGRLEDALVWLKRATKVRRSQESAAAHYNLGLVYRRLGDETAAEKSYREALRLKPGYIEARYNLALLRMRNRQYDQAVADFEKVAALGFSKSKLFKNLGVCYSRMGETAKAATAYEKAVELNPADAIGWFNLAVVEREMGQPIKAIDAYRQALEADSTYAEADFNLALLFADQDQMDSAAAYYRRAVAVNVGYTKAYYNLALLYSDKDQYDSAAAYFSKVIELDQGNLKALFNLGLMYSRMDRDRESAEAYRMLVDQDPVHEKGLNNLGTAFLRLGEFDSAYACFNRLVRLYNDPGAYFNRAKANDELGAIEAAKDDYRKAISLRPGYAKAYHNLAILEEKTGDLTEAVDLLEQAINYDTDNWKSHWKLGQVYIQLGMIDKARAEYTIAGNSHPDSKKFTREYENLLRNP